MSQKFHFNSGFEVDQLIAVSEAARNFSALRKNAKLAPRLILENNKPDSVLLSIEDYQHIQETLALLQNELVELKILQRIRNAQENGVQKQPFNDLMTAEDKRIYRSSAEWEISDEELFE